jgi:hypothetical protein
MAHDTMSGLLCKHPSVELGERAFSSSPGRTVSSGLRIGVIQSESDIDQIRPSWIAWKGHRDSDIDYYLELIRSAKNVIRPHVIVLYRDGQPDAILIGRLERARMDFKVGYLRLPSVPVLQLIFSCGGFRGNTSAENSREIVRSILESLGHGEADVAMLHQARAGSALYENALKLPGRATSDHLARPEARQLLSLPDSVEQLNRGFSQGLRAELRKKKRKLLADFDGRVSIRRVRDACELDAIIPDIEKIAMKTYQRGIGVGFVDTPETRRRLRFCAEKGWVRAYVVYIDDCPASFWTGTVNDGTFASDDVGYDPRFREYSPGSFVLMTLLEDLCAEGVREVDFGPGEAEYKARFGNHHVMEASVHIFAPSLKGLGLNAMRTMTSATHVIGKAMLGRANLLAPIKRFWRKRAARDTARPGPSRQGTNAA